MSLSRDEQSRLNDIESFTLALDPSFDSKLDLDAAVRQRDRWLVWCWCGVWAGAVMTLSGAGAARGFISIGTIICFLGLLLLFCSARETVRHLMARRRR